MRFTLITVLLSLISAVELTGQSSIDSVLSNIAKNNKTIIANTKYRDAKILEYKSGLNPNNPKVEYEYLMGKPANAGDQTDFLITQSFDFPTAYLRKKQLSKEQEKLAEIEMNTIRQDILLDAKLVCIDLIYQNKLHTELSNRKQNAEKWLDAFQRSLEVGDGNIMDVNKTKLQLLEINTTLQENISNLNQLNQKLTELNGGIPIHFSDTLYASHSMIPEFNALENEIEVKDLVLKYLEQEKVIGQNEIALSKSLTLPKIDVGYRYQTFLGERFNGVHFSLTIPLWENKNRVKTKQSELIMNEANLQEHINEHYFDIKQKYEQMTNLKISLDEYETVFSNLNNIELLDKSLSLGQISTIEYFMEMTFYYVALQNYLKIEMEYNKVVAELYKFQL
ncbi:MAG TPA: transporter [Bacteroidetes bacterium]|nr:transporter [Bacteroidota bacterium]